ncbi:MAG: hypothetical protein R2739_10500 [Chitinophagales bacterium]|nr:hypothetical protein [Bacteroidota bacterium]
MKKIIYVSILCLFFVACQNDKKTVEFKKVVDVEMGNLSKESAKLSAIAVFMNISQDTFYVKDLVLDYTIDGKDVGTIVTKSNKTIYPNSEFNIPIKYIYETTSFKPEENTATSTFAVQLIGNLNIKNNKGETLSIKVKHAQNYTYIDKKEIRKDKREERRLKRQEKKDSKDEE